MRQLILISIFVAISAWLYLPFLSGGDNKQHDAKPFTYPEATLWGKSKADKAITPFSVAVDKREIDDLKRRLAQWRRHEPLPNVGYSYGLSGAPLDKLVKYWQEKYDWAKAEAKLNTLPQFTTVIQGLKIHFIHAKGDQKATKRVPLLMVHGWPGSVVELYRAISLLTKVDKNGTAFDIVAPSIPGFGFSEAAAKSGFNPIAAAQVFHALMERLGYSKFVYQGGDWGSIIGSLLSRIYPDSVIGYHSNFVVPPTSTLLDKLHFGVAMLAPKWFLDKEDVTKLDKLTMSQWLEETGYFHIQATKPDTVGVGLSDSPIGLAAWIVEKFVNFTQNAEFKGDKGGISNDDLLTNVMVYWVTNHATSAARFYKETVQSMQMIQTWQQMPIMVPTGVACYPFEGLCSPRALLKSQMPLLVHYADIARGGHFAAFEEPDLFAQDLRVAVHAFYEVRDKELTKNSHKKVESDTKKQETKPTTTTTTTTTSKPAEQQKVTAKPSTQKPSPTTTPPPAKQAAPAQQKVTTTTTAKPPSQNKQPPKQEQKPTTPPPKQQASKTTEKPKH